MKVLIAGATGFIGGHLTKALVDRGDVVVVLTRDRDKARQRFADLPHDKIEIAQWDGQTASGWLHQLEQSDAVINLTGANIGEGRWTNARKRDLLDSRIRPAKAFVAAIREAKQKPKVLVQASGIGIYPSTNNGDGPVDESSKPGTGFIAELAQQWEHAAEEVASLGVRLVVIRTGVVLAVDGGALPKMLPPFKAGIGGPIGTGHQPMPWIHIDDEIGAILHALDNAAVEGPVNLVAPGLVEQRLFARELGKALHRPAVLPTPGFVLKLTFGEMAEELLLRGQKARPKKLEQTGYQFKYPRLDDALKQILQ